MLKKILAGVAILLVVAGGVIFYFWKQATALPDWYTEADAPALDAYQGDADDSTPPKWIAIAEDGREALDPAAAPPPEATTPQAAPSTKHRPRKKAKRHELRGFHRRGGKAPGESAVRASRAIYEDGALEAGVILDLSRLPEDQLSPKNKDLFDRALRNFPGLSKRDVYVGIDDQPIIEGGVPRLSDDPRIQVGKLRYSLDKAARKLGMAPEELRRELDRELERMGLPVN